MTGASLAMPDTMLEIEGRDALALDTETWAGLRGELRDRSGGVRAVLIRQIENVESSLIRYVGHMFIYQKLLIRSQKFDLYILLTHFHISIRKVKQLIFNVSHVINVDPVLRTCSANWKTSLGRRGEPTVS